MCKREVVTAIDLDEARIGNLLRQHESEVAWHSRIAAAVEHESGDLDQRQQRSHVEFSDSALYASGIFGRGREALQFVKRAGLLGSRVGPEPGREELPESRIGVAPPLLDQRQHRLARGNFIRAAPL